MEKIYKIIGLNKETAQITIQVRDLEPFVIDLPIDDSGNIPTGETLDNYIAGFIPHSYFLRKEKIAQGIKNLDDIISLVEEQQYTSVSIDDLKSAAIDQRNVLLVQSDWTQLPDVIMSDLAKAAWIEYRQLLRDLPTQPGFPDNIQWPVSPLDEKR